MDNLLNNNLKINKISDSIIIVDDILDNSVVNFLRLRMQTAKEFEDHYRDYAAINYTYNNDKFTADLSNELINRFKLNDFKRAWSFIYDNIAKGVGFHADPSSVNVNIWVTPEKSLLDKTKNGLLIVNKKPPDDWIREQWNGNKDGCIDKLLQKEKHEVTRIDYKCNRAVFFDGALFHATDDVSTKYGDYNRRVSYTMLFGNPVK